MIRNQKSGCSMLSRTPQPTRRCTRTSTTPNALSRRKILISPIQTIASKKNRTPIKKLHTDLAESKFSKQNHYSTNNNSPLVQNYSRIFNNTQNQLIKPKNSLCFSKLITKQENQYPKQSLVYIPEKRETQKYQYQFEPKSQFQSNYETSYKFNRSPLKSLNSSNLLNPSSQFSILNNPVYKAKQENVYPLSFKKQRSNVSDVILEESMELTKAGAGCKLVSSLEMDDNQQYYQPKVQSSIEESLLLSSNPWA